MTTKPRGRLLVLSGPSGTGKTTVARRLLGQRGGKLVRSVSASTRPRRSGEVDGDDYHFVNAEQFQRLLAAGDLLEYAELYGHWYGTPKPPVEDALARGSDVLLILDARGRRQLAACAEAELVSVFLLPPSLDELAKRLRNRNQDSDATVATRLAAARAEIAHCIDYDYVLCNDDLDATVAALEGILRRRHGSARGRVSACFEPFLDESVAGADTLAALSA